jgi:hypothetical protein
MSFPTQMLGDGQLRLDYQRVEVAILPKNQDEHHCRCFVLFKGTDDLSFSLKAHFRSVKRQTDCLSRKHPVIPSHSRLRDGSE